MAAYMSKLIPKTINIQILALKKKETHLGEICLTLRECYSVHQMPFAQKVKQKKNPWDFI